VNVAALILAAGRSTRMGGSNKLLATIDGTPLVRRAAAAALASRARPVLAVTGHEAGKVAAALSGLDVGIVHNPRHADGLSGSLGAGLAALPQGTDGVVILLADMPHVDAAVIDRLVTALDPARGIDIVVPTHDGRRGNPVVWSTRWFAALAAVTGDSGGRHLMAANPAAVAEVEIGGPASLDIDTPQALAAAGGRPA
jgi:molybdenum cofactor cytidylyltransferase